MKPLHGQFFQPQFAELEGLDPRGASFVPLWRQSGARLVMWVENGLDATSEWRKIVCLTEKYRGSIGREGGLAADQR
jgi:transposase